jgi:hypothetical protein
VAGHDAAGNLSEQVPGRDVRHARAADVPDVVEAAAERQPGAAIGADNRETADGYRGELFRRGRYRVAVCRQDLQWLFQRQRPGSPAGGAAWDTLGYCVSRESLADLYRSHVGADSPEIAALPEYFPEGGGDA